MCVCVYVAASCIKKEGGKMWKKGTEERKESYPVKIYKLSYFIRKQKKTF